MSQNRVIGQQNRIPWHFSEDLKWFKQVTSGHVVVMGRRTFESIGRPLPGRTTVVLSRSRLTIPGAQVLPNLESLMQWSSSRKVFICGGAQIYAQTMPLWKELLLTLVKREVEGDAYFTDFEQFFELAAVLVDRPEFQIRRYRRRSDRNPRK